MLRYRLGTIKDFHWVFKPVLSYRKPHTFSAFFLEKKRNKCAFTLSHPRIPRDDSASYIDPWDN